MLSESNTNNSYTAIIYKARKSSCTQVYMYLYKCVQTLNVLEFGVAIEKQSSVVSIGMALVMQSLCVVKNA